MPNTHRRMNANRPTHRDLSKVTEKPVTAVDLEMLKQLRIADGRIQSAAWLADGTLIAQVSFPPTQ